MADLTAAPKRGDLHCTCLREWYLLDSWIYCDQVKHEWKCRVPSRPGGIYLPVLASLPSLASLIQEAGIDTETPLVAQNASPTGREIPGPLAGLR